MNEKERHSLNEKIAFWLGFKKLPELEWFQPDRKWFRYINPSGQSIPILPHFTSSMDACIKWIVPKLDRLHYGYTLYEVNSEANEISIIDYSSLAKDRYDALPILSVCVGKSVPLTFCIAIGQIIDQEIKDASK